MVDEFTEELLSGVSVSVEASLGRPMASRSDESGRVRFAVRPGRRVLQIRGKAWKETEHLIPEAEVAEPPIVMRTTFVEIDPWAAERQRPGSVDAETRADCRCTEPTRSGSEDRG